MRDFESVMFTALLAFACAPTVTSAEVFRWVDDDGRVHFSDTRPDSDAQVTTVDVLAPRSSGYDPTRDPYSILNQASRIHSRWLDIALAGTRADSDGNAASAGATAAARQTHERERTEHARDATDPFGYFGPALLPAPPTVRPIGDRSRLARQQRLALETLELTGNRPPSINGSAHRERVRRSRALPLASAPNTRAPGAPGVPR